MYKRVVCRGFDMTWSNIKDTIRTCNIFKLTRQKFITLINNHHYYSDILLFFAAIIAVIQFSNQFYEFSIDMNQKILARTYIWMMFHKLVELAILIKYKGSQPKIFTEIKEEFKLIFR